MADVQVKLEKEEMDKTEQEKVMNNTEHDNASAAADQVAILNNAEVGGQNNDNIMNNNEDGRRHDGDINGDIWELEDINEMGMAVGAREFLGSYDNMGGGGWGEWKHDGGETWREWEFAAANSYYQDNDWVIDDLWVFDDHHYPNFNNGGSAAAANPRDPQA